MFSSLIENTCIIMTGILQVMMMRMMGRSVLKNIQHDKGYYTNQRCIELIETEQNCRPINFSQKTETVTTGIIPNSWTRIFFD